MSKQCKKCGHVSDLKEITRESACPKCGAVYAKVEGLMFLKPAASPVAAATEVARKLSRKEKLQKLKRKTAARKAEIQGSIYFSYVLMLAGYVVTGDMSVQTMIYWGMLLAAIVLAKKFPLLGTIVGGLLLISPLWLLMHALNTGAFSSTPTGVFLAMLFYGVVALVLMFVGSLLLISANADPTELELIEARDRFRDGE
jgi:hypothetical protein